MVGMSRRLLCRLTSGVDLMCAAKRPKPEDVLPQTTLLRRSLSVFWIFAPLIVYLIPADMEVTALQNPTKRTLFSIIWNCVSTIIICTWVSVHPNVPPSGRWRVLGRRLKMMFWTIIAPELVLAWAVRQWFAAREIRDKVNAANSDEEFREPLRTGSRNESRPIKWTMAHGHLLEMGGITMADPAFEFNNSENPNGQVLSFDRYKQLVRDVDWFRMPKITISDIADRSKADDLAKIIAIFKTTRFILQCIARHQQQLALTELELVALALASLNAVMYAFWWYKPLGVQEPIRIYSDDRHGPEMVLQRQATMGSGRRQEITISYVVSNKWMQEIAADIAKIVGTANSERCDAFLNYFIVLPTLVFLQLIFYLFLPFPLGIILLLKILKINSSEPDQSSQPPRLLATRILLALRRLRFRLTSSIAGISERWLRHLMESYVFDFSSFFVVWLFLLPALFVFLLTTTIFLLPFFSTLALVSFIFTAAFGIITSDTIEPGAQYVPSFYAPYTKSDNYSRMVVFALFGALFGGLHCIGWHFEYPTRSEQHLWQASSLAITVIPVMVAPIDCILANLTLDAGLFCKVVRFILELIMTILLFVYVLARLSLIAQAFALLRRQPSTAFIDVDWSRYLPDFF